MSEGKSVRFDLDRLGIVLALVAGGGGIGFSLVSTEDRFYGVQGRAIEQNVREIIVRLDYTEAEVARLRAELRDLDDKHPPETLLRDVGANEARVRQLELTLSDLISQLKKN